MYFVGGLPFKHTLSVYVCKDNHGNIKQEQKTIFFVIKEGHNFAFYVTESDLLCLFCHCKNHNDFPDTASEPFCLHRITLHDTPAESHQAIY